MRRSRSRLVARVPPTRVSKRHTTGWLIKLLTFFAQHIRLKHSRWLHIFLNIHPVYIVSCVSMITTEGEEPGACCLLICSDFFPPDIGTSTLYMPGSLLNDSPLSSSCVPTETVDWKMTIRPRCLQKFYPPTDGGDFRDFYHNWTNYILQQLERKFWKIADALFRIS
jgi:hypothetical protein